MVQTLETHAINPTSNTQQILYDDNRRSQKKHS